ncbi:MAG: hypothetical protein Q7T80_16640 [Methanoregula sp.]|nr:hypothetical protein [Methanoregula sp.]
MISRTPIPVLVAITLMLLLIIPAGAASIRHIDATVAENGDTSIVADYSLNWGERAIAYPAAVPLLSGVLGKNIQVTSVSPDKAELTIKHFVKVQQKPGSATYKTPAISLADARKELDKFWFGDMITLDGASGSLTFLFPDGEIIEYQGLTAIPSFEHVVSSQ